MNRISTGLILAILCVLLLGVTQYSSAAPQQSSPAAGIGAAKIAWINLEQVIYTCAEGKKEFLDVQQFVEKKNAELEALRKESEALKNQLSVQGSKLTDEARADLEDQIDARDTALQRFQQDTQKEIDKRREKVTTYVGKRLIPVIEKVAKEKGLTAVLALNGQRDAYVDASFIITEDIIKAYDQAYPVAAAKPAQPAK
jgi:Skp family chaperone for outer membrane proteins